MGGKEKRKLARDGGIRDSQHRLSHRVKAALRNATVARLTGELLLTGKGAQVRAGLGNHGLRCQNINAVDL
jgi:hypothetical protein